MKKFMTVLTLSAYLLFTSGVVVRSHFCMNKLASRHLFGLASSKCEICGMEFHHMNGCCSDEVQLVKKYQDQQTHEWSSFSLAKPEMPAPEYCTDFTCTLCLNRLQRERHNHSPPEKESADVYLLNCVFRI